MPDQMSANAPANPDAAWRMQTILFAALFMSTVMYGGVLFMALQQPASAPPLSSAIMLPALGSVAFLLLVAAFLLRRKLMPPLGDEPWRGDSSAKLTDAQGAALAKLFTANILAWAMSEAIAVFGLVLGMTCRDLNLLFPFVALSWVSFGLNRPQREVLDRVISGAQ